MAKLIRYVPSLRGIKQVRSSKEVDQDLERRGHAVASAAESHYAALGEDIRVEVVQEGSDTKAPRARVAVIARSPKALRFEVKHRVLGGALGAARG